ncbi:hypothetical protein PSR1_04438 [Anaeromyxobacter sp. PSR-1]|nr:hypothetical protein PSR1_04438 [Anaeromyxobacter sp. PSR-1]
MSRAARPAPQVSATILPGSSPVSASTESVRSRTTASPSSSDMAPAATSAASSPALWPMSARGARPWRTSSRWSATFTTNTAQWMSSSLCAYASGRSVKNDGRSGRPHSAW